MSRVALIGAGFIARVHADALRSMPNVRVSAVVDPHREAAERLAQSLDAPAIFASVDAALAADAFDRAHVLVPPHAHCDTALPVLRAGKPVLIEKPLAANGEQCSALLEAAAQTGAQIGVNQKFLHHLAFARLRHVVSTRALGKPNFVGWIYNVPLRQLAARQFGHWMFALPVNLLLEQAVHPPSQIASLAGDIGDIAAHAGPATELATGVAFHATLDASLRCAGRSARRLRTCQGDG